MQSLRLLIAVSAFTVACGGSADPSAPTTPGAAPSKEGSEALPTAPSSPALSTPPAPPVPSTPTVSGVVGFVLEPSNKTSWIVTRVDATGAAVGAPSVVTCAASSPWTSMAGAAVLRDGTILTLSSNGVVVKVDPSNANGCTTLGSLPASATAFAGLAVMTVGATDHLVTIDLGTVEGLHQTGVYSHRVMEIDPVTFATEPVQTITASAFPDSIHGWAEGRLALTFFRGDSILIADPFGADPSRSMPAPGLSKFRRAMTTGASTLLGFGDTHDSMTGKLPTYVLTPPNAIANGPELSLPGLTLFGYLTASLVRAL